MNQTAIAPTLAQKTTLARAIDSMLRPDDKLLQNAADARFDSINAFFAANPEELIDEAISTEFLAVNLIAMTPAKSEAWAAERIGELSEAQKTDPKHAENIKATAAAMRSAYVRFSHFRKLLKAKREYPAVYAEFGKLQFDWNGRMSWLVEKLDAAREEAKLNAASNILVVAGEKMVDGKVVQTITNEQAREQVAALNAAAKTIKDRAKAAPETVAADVVKLVSKRGAKLRTVIDALIALEYGAGHSVVSDDVIARLRAKVK